MRKPIQITLRPEAPSTPVEVFRCGLILPTAFRSPIRPELTNGPFL